MYPDNASIFNNIYWRSNAHLILEYESENYIYRYLDNHSQLFVDVHTVYPRYVRVDRC